MKKTNFMFVSAMLLTGSLLLISSCTSSDALSMNSDDSGQSASINQDNIYLEKESITGDFDEFDSLEKELEDLNELDLAEI